MKRVNFIFVLFASVIFLTSCAKDDDFIEDFSASNYFDRITQIPELETQRLAFDELTSQEKVELWKVKLDNLVKNNKFTTEQLSFIETVKNSINPSIYKKDSKELKVFQTIILKKLYNNGKKVFNNELELFRIFFNLSNIDLQKTQRQQQQKVCICSMGSAYTCGRVTGWISVEYGNCSGRKCVMTNSGCGGVWGSECDGSKCNW